MKKNIFLFLTVTIYIVLFFPFVLPKSQPTMGYSSIPDADADYLISLRIFRGEGLYSSFSILYPPGRFLLQALLFRLITPSYIVAFGSHVLFTMVLFPAAFFLLNVYFFELIFSHFHSKKVKKYSFLSAYFLSALAVLIYLDFFRSAQEAHFFSAVFFILLLTSKKLTKVKVFILGILLGLVYLFRIDSGVLLLNTLFFLFTPPVLIYLSKPHTPAEMKHKKLPLSFKVKGLWKFHRMLALRFTSNELHILHLLGVFVGGIAVVWIPILAAIIAHGSLFNFLYDTIVLGLIIQPKFMSLPIPQNELGLVWLSTLVFVMTTTTALIVESKKIVHPLKRSSLEIFSVFTALSFVAALGRADEPHLFYGLVWMPILFLYALIRMSIGLFRRERFSVKTMLLVALVFYLFCRTVLFLKSPTFFLIFAPLLFLIFRKYLKSVNSILIGGTLTTLLIFHSISYLRLHYVWESIPTITGYSYNYVISEGSEVGGFLIRPESDEQLLNQIRTDIPEQEKYLFIFPKNVVLNEYFHLTNPTRYVILMNERSDWTEQQVIDQLNQTQTKYFLVFPKYAQLRKAQVWDWLLASTTVVHEYQLSQDTAQLRVRK